MTGLDPTNLLREQRHAATYSCDDGVAGQHKMTKWWEIVSHIGFYRIKTNPMKARHVPKEVRKEEARIRSSFLLQKIATSSQRFARTFQDRGSLKATR